MTTPENPWTARLRGDPAGIHVEYTRASGDLVIVLESNGSGLMREFGGPLLTEPPRAGPRKERSPFVQSWPMAVPPALHADLLHALATAIGAYDLYQAFGGFAADDLVAKKKFEEKRAPQYLGALGEIYAKRPFAAGEAPCFADVIAHQAIVWVVRRNDVCRAIVEANSGLTGFVKRFEAVPAIHAFMQRQAKARETDNSL